MAEPDFPAPLEPTATDQRTFNRKTAERINFLLRIVKAQAKELADLKATP